VSDLHVTSSPNVWQCNI